MFPLMNQYTINLNTTPDAGEIGQTWSPLKAGITGFEPANNEEVDQTPYMDGNGWATSTVTGGQLTISVSGHRKTGDAAQDYVYSPGVQYALGDARETTMQFIDPEGNTVENTVTIVNIEGPSGEANTKGEISFELHVNGEPIFTPVV